MVKEKINLLNLKKLLEGRKWEQLTEEEKLEFSKKVAKQISKNSSNK